MTPQQKAELKAITLVACALEKHGAEALAERLSCTRQAVYLWAKGERRVPGWVVICLQELDLSARVDEAWERFQGSTTQEQRNEWRAVFKSLSDARRAGD